MKNKKKKERIRKKKQKVKKNTEKDSIVNIIINKKNKIRANKNNV